MSLYYFLFLVIYYQYNQSKIFYNKWVNIVELFDNFECIVNIKLWLYKKVDFISKEEFIGLIGSNQNSPSDPIIILDTKGMYDHWYIK